MSSPTSIEDTVRLLQRLRLAEPAEVAQARATLPPGSSLDDFLTLLERKQILTGLQSERIRKGETEGMVIHGYKLLYRNASGSFARVYRAASVETGQQVGMKVLRDRWSNDLDTVKLFQREGELGKRLKHPNIVPIYDVGKDGKFHFITMEFVEGGNLKDFLQIRRKLAPGEACRFGHDIARALEYAIRQGVTHRDLKLTNVLMSSSAVAKLIDFGLATDDAVMKRVGGNAMAQALEYSTLESGSGAPRNDPRSDLYFLGTILYELLTGSAPYPRTRDRDERKNFSRYRDVRPVTSIEPSLDWRIASIVDRLLQVNPALRYQTATEVAQELETVARNLGEKIGPASSASTGNGSSAPAAGTILCVEDRPKMQDVFRNYFTKHGFRVLLLTDVNRALARLKTSPPDCLVLFAEQGDQVLDIYREASRSTNTPVVLILGSKQADLTENLQMLSQKSAVLTQPVQLRDLRVAIEKLISEKNGRPG